MRGEGIQIPQKRTVIGPTAKFHLMALVALESISVKIGVCMRIMPLCVSAEFLCLSVCQSVYISEVCIGVLGIQDICHFTSSDIGYCNVLYSINAIAYL